MTRLVSFACALALVACGSSTPIEDPDASLMDAAIPSDAGATVDAGATAEDAGTPAEDAGEAADAGPTDDAGIDCSTIGCGAPVVCGEECESECGCCACGGEGRCDGNVAVNCLAAGCYAATDCGAGGCEVVDGLASCDSCARIEEAYEALVSGDATTCGGAGQCRVLTGHCGVGLGGCYYGVNTQVTQAQLDDLAAQWTAQGCTGAVCRCTAPPDVRCDAGGCLLQFD